MKYISVFLLLVFCECCSQSFHEKGDVYSLRINSSKNLNEYERKIHRMENTIRLKEFSSYNKSGLRIFDNAPYTMNLYYFFIPKEPSESSFFINNIN